MLVFVAQVRSFDVEATPFSFLAYARFHRLYYRGLNRCPSEILLYRKRDIVVFAVSISAGTTKPTCAGRARNQDEQL